VSVWRLRNLHMVVGARTVNQMDLTATSDSFGELLNGNHFLDGCAR
jgi:hypothetical protein